MRGDRNWLCGSAYLQSAKDLELNGHLIYSSSDEFRKEKAAAAKAQESYVVYEPMVSAIGNVINPGQNSRLHRSSSACVVILRVRQIKCRYEDCDAQATGDQKQASRLCNAMNGAKDPPWENSISDLVSTQTRSRQASLNKHKHVTLYGTHYPLFG